MAVNASYQLPKEPPQPTDLQVQNFILNDTEGITVPSTGDLFNPTGPGTGPGVDPDPGDDGGGFDWAGAADYAQDTWNSLGIPEEWGTSIQEFDAHWNTFFTGEETVLQYLGGYTGFQHRADEFSDIRSNFADLTTWYNFYMQGTGEGYEWGVTPLLDDWENPAYGVGQFLENFPSTLEGYTGQHAPEYWSGFFDISDEDLVLTAEEMLNAFEDEDWLELYGPWLANMGIGIDEWMEQYGEYLTPPDVNIQSDLLDTRDKMREESRSQVYQQLDSERMNMVKTGFQTSYQSASNLNNIITDFDNLINDIDNQAQEGLNNYAEGYYADWLSLNMNLAEMGAFDPDTFAEEEGYTDPAGDPEDQEIDLDACLVNPYAYGFDCVEQCWGAECP